MKKTAAWFLALISLAFCVNADTPENYWTAQWIIASILCLIVGAALCTFGYRLFRIILVVVGFIIGYSLCYILLDSYWPESDGYEWYWNALISLVPGCILAILMHCFFVVAIFVIGFLLGFVLSIWLMSGVIASYTNVDVTEWWWLLINWTVIIITGLLLGILAIRFEKMLIIIGTSIVGAFLFVVGLDYLVYFDDGQFAFIIIDAFKGQSSNFTGYTWILIAIWFVLSIVAFFVQMFVTGKHYDHRGHQHHHHEGILD